MSFCGMCGSPISPHTAYCGVCGAPQTSSTSIDPMPALAELGTAAPSGAIFRLRLPLDVVRQSRWSVLFRGVLALPLLLFMVIAGTGLFFVVISGWLGALFLGRLPEPQRRYITNFLRFSTDLDAYLAFVTDKWPGVQWHPRPGAAVVVEADPVRLRRTAVFFRLWLAIPALVVAQILSVPSTLLQLLQWFWGILAGRQSLVLHQSRCLLIRYQQRTVAYYLLLTPTQPFEKLLGDSVLTSESAPSGGDPFHWAVVSRARQVVVASLVVGAPLLVVTSHYQSAFVPQPLSVAIGHLGIWAGEQSYQSEISTLRSLQSTCASSEMTACFMQQQPAFLKTLNADTQTFSKIHSLVPGREAAFTALEAVLAESYVLASRVSGSTPSSSTAVTLQVLTSTLAQQFTIDARTWSSSL